MNEERHTIICRRSLVEEWKTFSGPRESCHPRPRRVEGLHESALIPSIPQPLALFPVLGVVVVVDVDAVVADEAGLVNGIVGALEQRARVSGASLATTWALYD